MHANLIKALQDLRASYWFIPSCMALAAFALSFFMQWLDARYGAAWLRDFDWLTATRTEGARSVLTVIAGSIIGVAGVTFSITMVAVSYASANFGPRLVGNFMRDRGNQITLGTFIATFVYCLMALRTVRGAADDSAGQSFDAFVPHLSILVALFLALASISVLIYFIHHVPETINVGNIAAKIGEQLRNGILNTFPNLDEIEPSKKSAKLSWSQAEKEFLHTKVDADRDGYVQALDEAQLGEIAGSEDLLIRVQFRPGDFVTLQDAILDVWAENEIGDDIIRNLQACYAIGQQRTANQNILFLVDELVEIIARALSPGINDPFTAITCFNWLKVCLVCFALREEKQRRPAASDPVQLYPVDFERFVSAIFDQSRQYVCRDRNVSIHVITVLTETAALIPEGPRRHSLITQMQKLANACAENMRNHEGGADVAARYEDALRMLSDPCGHEKYRGSQKWFGSGG